MITLKIDLKKERFESIDKAFALMKENNSNRSHACALIKSNLKSTFGKNIDIYQTTDQIMDVQFSGIHSAA